MRKLKWVGLSIGGVLVLIMGALLLAVLFLDPNDYRGEIEHIVEEQTSRQFTLEGDLELSVFPWLAVEFGPAQLSDAPGFGDEPFVAVQHARLSVRLWPLLRGAVEIGNVRLDGVNVRLITDAQGRSNWADLRAAEADVPVAEADSPSIPTIAGLDIRDAAISLEDRRDDSRIAVRMLNLETGRLVSGETFDLNSDFLLEASPELSASVEFAARVTADFGAERYRLDDLVMEASLRGEGFLDAGVPLVLRAAALDTDLAAQTLELKQFDLEVADAKFAGGLAGREILDAPRLEGQLRLGPVSLREWLPRLGIEVPVTRDPRALTTLSFESKVTLTPSSADFQDSRLLLDETTAKGSFGVVDFATQAMHFDLDVDRIDADRYLAPESAQDAAQAASSEPIEIPVAALKQLNARGTVDIGEVLFAGIKFTGLHLGITARNGNLRINSVEGADAAGMQELEEERG